MLELSNQKILLDNHVLTNVNLFNFRISKRYRDPAKAYNEQSPVTRRSGHSVEASATPPPPPTESQNKDDSKPDNGKCKKLSHPFQQLKSVECHHMIK